MGWDNLPAALREYAEGRDAGLRKAMARTVEVDAPRWIQWSIRGGGFGAGADAPIEPAPPKRKVKKGTKSDPCPRRKPPRYRKPIDTGEYAASWKSQVTKSGALFYSTSNPIKTGVIEEGRRAAGIPIEPLAQWVRRKLGCRNPKRARSIAFLISRAAKKRRRPGLHVLKRAHPRIAEAFQRNVQQLLGESISAHMSMRSFKRT